MISEAKNVVQECKDSNERAWAYEAIIEALVKEGRYDEAMSLARSIDEMLRPATQDDCQSYRRTQCGRKTGSGRYCKERVQFLIARSGELSSKV